MMQLMLFEGLLRWERVASGVAAAAGRLMARKPSIAPVQVVAPVVATVAARSKPRRRAQGDGVLAGRNAARVRYDAVIAFELAEHSIKVRKWRRSMSGMAWQLRDQDGAVFRLLESPRPASPMSCAIFLHEVGHHAIGFSRYKPRCLEEYHAWRWSLQAMGRHGVPITEEVQDRVFRSLRYAVGKALRRGLKALPPELAPFTPVVLTERHQPEDWRLWKADRERTLEAARVRALGAVSEMAELSSPGCTAG